MANRTGKAEMTVGEITASIVAWHSDVANE